MSEGAARALGMGAIAGLRSMAAPAALSRAARRGEVDGLQDTPFALLGSSKASKLLTLFEWSELSKYMTPEELTGLPGGPQSVGLPADSPATPEGA